mmetsp:Transcript_13151/g.14781  ORF Transcript_13151/g.14781 Transcript_13151/m.14781 type:complete len:82 (+) Transcript_13151:28-273(+)
MCGQGFFGYRRNVLVFLLLILLLFTFASYSSGYWQHWTVLFGMFFFLVLTDFVFLGENTFVFDPSRASWAVRTGEDGSAYN